MTQPYSSRDKNETAVRLKNTGMPPFVYGSHICGHTVKLDPFKQPQQNTEMHQSWIENVKLFSVSLNQKAQHLMFRGNNTRKRKSSCRSKYLAIHVMLYEQMWNGLSSACCLTQTSAARHKISSVHQG